jgi:hypothetical protein
MRRRTILAVIVIGLLVFAIFGQRMIAFPISYLGSYWSLNQNMKKCPADQLRIERFRDSYDLDTEFWSREIVTVDLGSGKMTLDLQAPPQDAGYGLLWMRTTYPAGWPTPYLTTDKVFPPPEIDPPQLAKLRAMLAGLEPPGPSAVHSYRNQVHAAFWQHDQLYIYHFSNADASQLHALAAALTLPDDFFQVLNTGAN